MITEGCSGGGLEPTVHVNVWAIDEEQKTEATAIHAIRKATFRWPPGKLPEGFMGWSLLLGG